MFDSTSFIFGVIAAYVLLVWISVAFKLRHLAKLRRRELETNPWVKSPTIYADVSRKELADAMLKANLEFHAPDWRSRKNMPRTRERPAAVAAAVQLIDAETA